MKNHTKIKSMLVLLSLVFFLFSLSSCNKIKTMSIEEFEDKYKRAEFDEFLNNPKEFIQDFNRTDSSLYYYECDSTFFDDWEKEKNAEEYYWNEYEKGVVLFNKSASFHVSLFPNNNDQKERISSFHVEFHTGNEQDNINIGKALANELFNLYGNAQKIEIESTQTTESEFLKMMNSNDISHYSLDFTNEKYDKEMDQLIQKYSDTDDQKQLEIGAKKVGKIRAKYDHFYNYLSGSTSYVSLY